MERDREGCWAEDSGITGAGTRGAGMGRADIQQVHLCDSQFTL